MSHIGGGRTLLFVAGAGGAEPFAPTMGIDGCATADSRQACSRHRANGARPGAVLARHPLRPARTRSADSSQRTYPDHSRPRYHAAEFGVRLCAGPRLEDAMAA